MFGEWKALADQAVGALIVIARELGQIRMILKASQLDVQNLVLQEEKRLQFRACGASYTEPRTGSVWKCTLRPDHEGPHE